MGPLVESLSEPQFDIAAILAAYDTVRMRATARTASRGDDTLSSISLTHRPGAVDPLHDGSNSQFDSSGRMVYQEKDFRVFNKVFEDTYFFEIYRALPFFPGRMRLMILPPLKIYGMHRDATKRAHIAIVTNPDCRITFRNGDSFHIPADGRVYVADTRSLHTAYNAGHCERVHLAISMAETGNPAKAGESIGSTAAGRRSFVPVAPTGEG
jgi:hypothetical protein